MTLYVSTVFIFPVFKDHNLVLWSFDPTLIFSYFRFILSYVTEHNFFFVLLQIQVIILSVLTNILIDHLTENATDGDLQQLFSELFVNDGGIYNFCSTFPDLRIFISPPNVRLTPTWYSRLRSSIVRTFHQFLEAGPPNLQAIEVFPANSSTIKYIIPYFLVSITFSTLSIMFVRCWRSPSQSSPSGSIELLDLWLRCLNLPLNLLLVISQICFLTL